MRLEYYYLVFEDRSEDCPGELWETILHMLNVVFSAYGYAPSSNTTHDLHVICEDDCRRSRYKTLPMHITKKIAKKADITKDLVKFARHMIPVLLEDSDLCVVDNTKTLFDLDDKND